jgi:hypothetical protein
MHPLRLDVVVGSRKPPGHLGVPANLVVVGNSQREDFDLSDNHRLASHRH